MERIVTQTKKEYFEVHRTLNSQEIKNADLFDSLKNEPLLLRELHVQYILRALKNLPTAFMVCLRLYYLFFESFFEIIYQICVNSFL